MLEANDSLADFGCLQTEEIIKWSIMDNYKTHKGIVTEKLRAAVGKSHISFNTSETTHFLQQPSGTEGGSSGQKAWNTMEIRDVKMMGHRIREIGKEELNLPEFEVDVGRPLLNY